MGATSVGLADSLHRRVKEIAERGNASINQPIAVPVAEDLSALETEDYLDKRSARATRARFREALRKINDREPDPYYG